MINAALYKRELKGSLKLLLVLAAVITLYVSVIISMYDPKMAAMLDGFAALMPQLMAAVGMRPGATSLMDFMASYLYGFVLPIFPMVFCILRGNGLIAKHIDRGSMATLLAAPVKRRAVVITQAAVLISGVLLLHLYTTVLELVCAAIFFPRALNIADLLALNGGLVCLHLFIGGICFLASCASPDIKYSIGLGACIPSLMYVLQMLANMGGKAAFARYFTFFTLFDPTGILAGSGAAIAGVFVLLAGAVLWFALSAVIFCRRDLSI